MTHAFLCCGRAWRDPRKAGLVAGAFAVGIVAAVAFVEASPWPASLRPNGGTAMRQADDMAGTPCTVDDDCGGYAVFPPLWCRRGEGSYSPTCRKYVGEGEVCDNAGVLCNARTRAGDRSLSCVNGTCSTFASGLTRGDECPVGQSPSPCVDGHICKFIKSVRRGGRCVSVGTAGDACGGPLALCAEGTECIDGDTGEACPMTRTVGAPPLEVEERSPFPLCTNNATAAGGTCRAADKPSVGTLCNSLGERDDVCPRSGDDNLICSRVTNENSKAILRCVQRTAPGAPCALSGTSFPTICSEQPRSAADQLCINGTCVEDLFPNSPVSSLGNECNFQGGCSGGDDLTCRFWSGFANSVCWRQRVPAGGACGPEAFGICNQDAGLTCTDGVCVTAEAAQQGEVCDARLSDSCDQSAVGNRTGWTSCRLNSSGDDVRRCFFVCGDGETCEGEFDICSDGRLMDGVCVFGQLKGDPCNIPTADCDSRRGLFCRPIDGDGGGSGSNIRDVNGVCAVTAEAGEACDATTGDQCRDGLRCVDRVCVERSVGLGEACDDDTDCKNTDDGQPTSCWRGRGATGKTCRAWRGPYESCARADSKCWRSELTCVDDGDDSVCVNAQGRGDLGAYCRLDGSDCTGAEYLFCQASRFTSAPVCKRFVEEGESCDPGLGSDLRLCRTGNVCRYNGRFSGRPVGYFCQKPIVS